MAKDSIVSPTGTLVSRVAKRKKDLDLEAPGEKPAPGSASTSLRRLMSDPLADIFSQVGTGLYEKSVKSIQDDLTKIFSEGVQSLGETVKQKLGEYGFEESREHFRAWMKDIMSDIVDAGVPEIVGSLENMISSLSSSYDNGEAAGAGGLEGMEGLDVQTVGEDEVEEVKEEAVAPEETPEAPASAGAVATEGTLPGSAPGGGGPTGPVPMAPAPGTTSTPGTPEAGASVKPRTYRVTPELKEIYAASRRRFKLTSVAEARIAETKKQ